VIVVVTGGFVTTASGLRFSAHSPLPAFALATVCVVTWAGIRARRGVLQSELQRLEQACAARWRLAVAATAVVAALVGARYHTFSATGADASGYLSYAQALVALQLDRQEPLAAIATWRDGPTTIAPLGWRPAGDAPDRQVPTYAIGLPLLLAPFLAAGGDTAASLLMPMTFGFTVLVIGAIAYRVKGGLTAVVAAVWLATSPVALIQSMQIMSDGPVTAAWLACWWAAYTKRSLLAGIAAGFAILIRPNLAPLAVIPALYLMTQEIRHRRVAVLRFAAPVAAACAAIAAVQWRQFGSAFRSGYGTVTELYDLANLVPNAGLYAQWLLDVHGPWLFLAPLAVMVNRRELGWGLSFAVAVVLAYLVFAVFESWTYLRFMLPALVFLMIAMSALLAVALHRMPVGIRVAATALVILALVASNLVSARAHGVFRLADRQARGRFVGQQLAGFLPVNAVIVSAEQSGTMRYYTGRSILRWDLIAPEAMAGAIDRLTLNGYQLWVVLDDWEDETFRRKFPSLAAASLDYEPAVESAAGVGIRTRAWRARRDSARSSNNE
jgi:hypothetical protein